MQTAMAPSEVWGRKRKRETRLTPTSRPTGSLLLGQQRFLVHRMTGQLGTLRRGLSNGSQFPFRPAALWKARLEAQAVFRVERTPTAVISDPPERDHPLPFGEPCPRGRYALSRFTPVAPRRGRKENAA
jgi:hypothetical protein